MLAGCNADKRRQPRKHWMGFDNVQGMDDAKQKLVKVNMVSLLLTHDCVSVILMIC